MNGHAYRDEFQPIAASCKDQVAGRLVRSIAGAVRFAGLNLVLVAALAQSAAAQSGTALALELDSTSVVFEYDKSDPYDRSNLYGFNHGPSVTLLADGRLLAAWFSGPYEASVHQVILAAYSADGGRTWSEATELYDTPRISDFDPAFIRDEGTTWAFFSAGRWTRHPFLGTGPRDELTGVGSFKIFVRRTEDSGKTWSQTVRAYDGTGWGCRSNGIKLSTGELILPIHSFEAPHTAAVLRSTDGGESWRRSQIVKTPNRVGAAEPCVAELDGGRLLMVVRSRDGSLWTCQSGDRGQTWRPPQQTTLPAAASSHSLIRASDGALVLTHNPSKPPLRTPLTIRLSRDEGRTWSEPLELASAPIPHEGDEFWSRQVSYPSAIQLPDGVLLAVWTKIELSVASQSGVIQAARVRLVSSQAR